MAVVLGQSGYGYAEPEFALDDIPGIGPATREKLLSEFKSLKRIREASFEMLSGVIGTSKATKLMESLGKK